MTQEQINNSKLIIDSLNKFGVKNQYIQAAILATISKESELIPKSEKLGYTVANIKRVFPALSSKATQLANNPEALGNAAYGGKYGNAANEGYKYRGRGFNQITFKNIYDEVGKGIGVNLVASPDLLNDPKIAADAAAYFYSKGLKSGNKLGTFKKFGVTDFNSVSDTLSATKIAVQVNAGLGTNFKNNIVQEGFTKASAKVDGLFDLVKNYTKQGIKEVGQVAAEVKKNPC